MKTKKMLVIPVFAILFIVTACLWKRPWLNNNSDITLSGIDITTLPIYQMGASFVYNTDDAKEAVGISDLVFVGKVISNAGTQYKDVVTMEDENGNPREVGTPYTYYTVEVLKNLKGELIMDKPITLSKHGGVMPSKDAVFVFENDELPVVGNTYIFLGYCQEDGSILISGPSSNVAINFAVNRLEQQDIKYQEYRLAVENEVIPIERKRFKSIYEK